MSTIRVTACCVSSLLVAASSAPTVRQISFCDLSAHPSRYLGHVVSVWATYSPTLNRTAALSDDRCKPRQSVALSKTTGDPLHNLSAYRAPDEIKSNAFRIWGRFIGTVVRERPVTDAYLADDGLHFRPIDVVDVRAVNVPVEG